MNKLLFLCLALYLVSCGTNMNVITYDPPSRGSHNLHNYKSQSRADQKMPNEPGKCYAKCLMPDEVQMDTFSIFVYTGDELPMAGVSEERIVLSPASTEWVKKKREKGCLSKNPEDCLVWCLQENKAEEELFHVVKDTTIVDAFEVHEIIQKTIISQGGFTEWKAVVCESNINHRLIANLTEQLNLHGYHCSNEPTNIIGPELKNALIKYQKDNTLPV